jgi:general secretion pathway protein K
MRRERGFALMLVIWALIVMTGLAAGFGMAVRYEARLGQDAVAELRNEAAMITAVHMSMLHLDLRDSGQRWRADGRWYAVAHPDGVVRVRIRAESGRIDINRAPRVLLLGLFEQLLPDHRPEALVDALLDWRDRDDDALPQGAEAADYRALGYAYGPANQPFESVHALSRVAGFDAAMVEEILPYVTIHSRQPRINALSADPVTLAALPDVDAGAVRSFIDARSAAIDAGRRPSIGLLSAGKRYLRMNIEDKVVSVEIDIRLRGMPPRRQELVLRRGPQRYYEVLARRDVGMDRQPGPPA